MQSTPAPYCGTPPAPQDWLAAWTFDPWVLVPLLALLLWSLRRVSGAGLLACFWLALAFVSPLCALSSALFSVRILHHVLLVAFAAPCLALLLKAAADHPIMKALASQPFTAFLLHTLLFWFWHAPGPYEAALGSNLLYWTMELSLLGSALWLWMAVLPPSRAGSLSPLFLVFASMGQMGFLGALLVFAPMPLYGPHFLSAPLYGLTPLGDQQLAGVMMWVPASLPYLFILLTALRPLLREDEARP